MDVVESRMTGKNLLTEFSKEEQKVRALRTALAASGQAESSQRFKKLELALQRVREKLVELESTQLTSTDLLDAYEAILDLIEAVDEILDQRGTSVTLSESVPLVG